MHAGSIWHFPLFRHLQGEYYGHDKIRCDNSDFFEVDRKRLTVLWQSSETYIKNMDLHQIRDKQYKPLTTGFGDRHDSHEHFAKQFLLLSLFG